MCNFFFCHYVFKKPSAAEASESVYMRERVKKRKIADDDQCPLGQKCFLLHFVYIKIYPFPSYNNSAADDFERILSKNRNSP